MKKLILIPALMVLSVFVFAQKTYIVEPDSANINKYYFTGLVSQQDLLADSIMKKWYHQSRSYYKPDTTLVNQFAKAKEQKISFLVFGGTWCEDSQYVLPKLFKLQELSGLPPSSISIISLNRDKKDPANIANALGVTLVPTVIVFKDGKELGRVVEYGKTGKWDEELADLIP